MELGSVIILHVLIRYMVPILTLIAGIEWWMKQSLSLEARHTESRGKEDIDEMITLIYMYKMG